MNVQNMLLMFHSLMCSWTVHQALGTVLMLGYPATIVYCCLINSLGPIATKVINSVCNPEGLRNEKNVKKSCARSGASRDRTTDLLPLALTTRPSTPGLEGALKRSIILINAAKTCVNLGSNELTRTTTMFTVIIVVCSLKSMYIPSFVLIGYCE